MKRFFYLTFLTVALMSCKKDSPEEGDGSQQSFINTTAGSVWNYKEVNASDGDAVTSDYSVTSLNKDTVINGRNYHVYQYSYGGSKYLAKSKNDYYEYANIINMGQEVERLYLKANAPLNASWSEEHTLVMTHPITITLRLKATNQIVDIGNRTVEGKLYENVVHVKTIITSPDIPANGLKSDIHSYFAPEFGMIENSTLVEINYLGFDSKIDLKTTLTSSTLQ